MPFPAVHPALDRALSKKGYAEPTSVQAAVLEVGHGDADLLVSAQTGSGKTVAFGLAAAHTLFDGQETLGQAGAPLMLAIAPTRELALQVAAELTWLYGEAGAKITTCVGGMDSRKEARALQYGAHIVVGTPGRLKDHIDRRALDLSKARVIVLDEADEMLDMGFRDDLEYILEQAPSERRTLLFSATIARDIAVLAKRYQNDAIRIDTVDRSQPHNDIEYRAMRVIPNQIEGAVVNVLRYFEAPSVLVFCSTRASVNNLQAALLERGFASVALSGEMGQRERNEALQALRDGRARVCVATDVAARGLDLPDLGLVVHAELPINKATMLHRSGRTGRAGKKGISVLLVPHSRRRKAEMLLHAAGVEAVWSGAPTSEEILVKDEQRLLAAPIFTQEPAASDAELIAQMVAERTPDQLAAAVVNMLRKNLPTPANLSDPGDGGQRKPRREGEAYEPSPMSFDRLSSDECTWFRMDIGRNRNADPKWLIPMICRIGGITKAQIGSIKTFPEETRFEIATSHADAFKKLAEMNTQEAHITTSEAPAAGMFKGGHRNGPRDGGRDFGGREGGRPSFGRKPFCGNDRGERTERPQGEWKERSEFKPRTEGGDRPDRGAKPFRPRGDFDNKPSGFKGKPAGGKPYAGKPAAAGAKPGFKKPRRFD